jgi:hypothetical protein
MRKLTKGQQGVLVLFDETGDFDDLPDSIQVKLRELNDYETLHHDATRFLMDRFLAKMYGRGGPDA